MSYSGAGGGTDENPYLITSQSELAEITANMGVGIYWDLVNDITLTGTWTALCSSGAPFLGYLRGNGFTISGITVNNYTDYQGLFAAIGAATVEELNLSGSVTGRDFVGLLAGTISASAITNVDVVSLTISARSYAGGIAGSILNSSAVSGCSVGNATTSAGTITGSGGSLGGAFGTSGSSAGTITNCLANATVACTNGNNAGGFIGYNMATITKSIALGNVTGYGYCGGFSGYNYSTGTTEDCEAKGNVTRTGTASTDYIGGFVGWNRVSATRCFSCGLVTFSGDSTYAGGFAGSSVGGANTDCFWDTTTSGMATSNGGTGLTTAQATQEASFTNWNFTTVWQIFRPGTDYPWLQAIIPPYIFLISVTPEEEVQSYNVAIDLFGYNLEDSMSIWLERDTYSSIIGEIFDVDSNTCRAIFEIGEAMPGEWTIVLADPSGTATIGFTIGSPGDIPTPLEIAGAVWQHILSDVQNPSGSAGRILNNISVDFDPVLDALETLLSDIDDLITASTGTITSAISNTETAISTQVTEVSESITSQMDGIKGEGFSTETLVSIYEKADNILSRYRQQNNPMNTQIMLGAINKLKGK